MSSGSYFLKIIITTYFDPHHRAISPESQDNPMYAYLEVSPPMNGFYFQVSIYMDIHLCTYEYTCTYEHTFNCMSFR